MCQKRKTYIAKLRKVFLDLNIHAIIIPSADPHQSEYLADYWKLREWISGFTGSAGTIVITKDVAGLWTDSRYYLQAVEELEGSGITLFRQGEKGVPGITEYLKKNLKLKSRIALNARMWSFVAVDKMQNALEENEISITTDFTLCEDLWNEEGRPSLPKEKVFIHPLVYSGTSVAQKLDLIREKIKDEDVSQCLITTLDDIAWAFNLRGYDIAYNPVFLSYAIIDTNGAHIFIDTTKITSDVAAHLKAGNVTIHEYDLVDKFLSELSEPILVNPNDCNVNLYHLIDEDLITEGPTVTKLLKACKTSSEIKHIEDVMVKDGIALAEAFYQLYQSLDERPMTEAAFAGLIAERRSKQKGYYGESFPAIIGYQANAAIVHYRPPEEGSALIKPEGLLLCDSGGQYMNGTTDITRTVAVGPVTDEQKENYTRVLKGHIAIDQAVFPEGTTGGMIDTLARQYLWKAGLNFGHGTGHGVGYFLNVHEPPQGISPGTGARSTTAFRPGMLTSNEPGYYKAGHYGIRIENLILTEESSHEGYLCHRHVTLFPIDTSLITRHMMTRDEISWINKYHELVGDMLLPYLESELSKWLKKLCRPI